MATGGDNIEARRGGSASGGPGSEGVRKTETTSALVAAGDAEDAAVGTAAGPHAASGSSGGGRRRRSRTEGSMSSALRFLSRSETSFHSSGSSTTATATASTSPYPEGFNAREIRARPRAWTFQPLPPPPRTSPLAFLERVPHSTSMTSLLTAAGADAGLGSLSGGELAVGASRGGFLPHPRDNADEQGLANAAEEELDANVCPSMLFSCFPCLACLRPSRPRRLTAGSFADTRTAGNLRTSRSQESLTAPLLGEQSLGDTLPTPEGFPKDLKLIEVEVESARNIPTGTTGYADDLVGPYVSLRMTPVQEGVGEQIQQTSVATRVVNPRWGGHETFTFFVADTGNAKAFLALYLFLRPLRPPSPPLPAPPPPPTLAPRRRFGAAAAAVTADSSYTGSDSGLPPGSLPGDVLVGEGLVDVQQLFPAHHGTYAPGGSRGAARRVGVGLWDPVGKRRSRCTVNLGLRSRRVNETIDTVEDRLYEYQQWTQITGWKISGGQGSGKWSTLDGSAVSESFAAVAPEARDDSEVVLPWCPFGGWEYSRDRSWDDLDTSRTGTGAVWVEGFASGTDVVRRRLWRRVYLERGLPSKSAGPL